MSRALAQLLDLGAQLGLAVEPLARDPGATGDVLERDADALGGQLGEASVKAHSG